MEIQITQAHIGGGVCGDSEKCAAALALLAAGFAAPRVGHGTVDVTLRDGRMLTYRTTASLTDWLTVYDRGAGAPTGRLILSHDWPTEGPLAGFVADAVAV